MATITGLTAERMREIEAASIVDGRINPEGHLILSRYDGGELDAGNALVALPEERAIHFLSSGYVNNTPPGSYPDGVSLLWIDGSTNGTNWPTFAGKWGSILTINYTETQSPNDTTQVWTRLHGSGTTPEQWIRSGNTGGWSSWKKLALSDEVTTVDAKVNATNTNVTSVTSRVAALETIQVSRLASSNFTQASPNSVYPSGESLMYMTTLESTAGGWDFGGKAGTIRTFRSGNDVHQTWQRTHQNTTHPEFWVRGGNASGWAPWFKVVDANRDTGWINLTYTSGYSAGTPEQLQYRVVDRKIYFRGGATGTFTAGVYQNVADPGAIPAAYRPTQVVRGGAMGTGMRPCGFEINTDGSIKLGSNGLASQPSWIAFNTSYPL